MTTKISLLSGLITGLLFGTALTLAATPTPTPKQMGQAQSQTPTPKPEVKFDNVLTSDYSQAPSSKTPSAKGSTTKKSPTPEQWKKTADDAQGRYSVDFDAQKSPTPERKVYHPGDANDPNTQLATPTPSAKADKSSSTDRQGQHKKHKKKNKKKHHHHHDDD